MRCVSFRFSAVVRLLRYIQFINGCTNKYAGILYCHLSPNNIVCRFFEKNARGEMEQRVYGVPTDYDLSSLTATMNSRHEKTTQQRTRFWSKCSSMVPSRMTEKTSKGRVS